jgi:hypothetical protein
LPWWLWPPPWPCAPACVFVLVCPEFPWVKPDECEWPCCVTVGVAVVAVVVLTVEAVDDVVVDDVAVPPHAPTVSPCAA